MEFDDDDETSQLTDAIRWVGNAITPGGVAPGPDETGSIVGSLTEAVMGMTAGLVRIASAIEDLEIPNAAARIADAIESLAEAINKRPEK